MKKLSVSIFAILATASLACSSSQAPHEPAPAAPAAARSHAGPERIHERHRRGSPRRLVLVRRFVQGLEPARRRQPGRLPDGRLHRGPVLDGDQPGLWRAVHEHGRQDVPDRDRRRGHECRTTRRSGASASASTSTTPAPATRAPRRATETSFPITPPRTGVTGFKFDVTGVPLGGNMRAEFPFMGQTRTNAPYWMGKANNLSPITTDGTYSFKWTDVNGPMYATSPTRVRSDHDHLGPVPRGHQHEGPHRGQQPLRQQRHPDDRLSRNVNLATDHDVGRRKGHPRNPQVAFFLSGTAQTSQSTMTVAPALA